MNNFNLEATASTPAIRLKIEEGKLWIEGESYPENSIQFYTPILELIEQFFEEASQLEVNIKLDYFNTSSSKCLLDLLTLLDKKNELGKTARVIWYYREDDEDIMESGQEFAEDFSLEFQYVSY